MKIAGKNAIIYHRKFAMLLEKLTWHFRCVVLYYHQLVFRIHVVKLQKPFLGLLGVLNLPLVKKE